AIEMPNAAGPQRTQYTGVRVAFDGVENITGKATDKPPCRRGNRRGAQAQQRIGRPRSRDDRIDRRENGAPERASGNKRAFRPRTSLRNQGATPPPRDGGGRRRR